MNAAQPASDIVHRHVAAASERAQKSAQATAAATGSHSPEQTQLRSALDTARSVLLLAVAALAAGATAGVLSYLLFVKAAPQRQRGSKKKAGSTTSQPGDRRRQPRSASEPGLRRPSQKSGLQQSDVRRAVAQQPVDGGQGQEVSSFAAGRAHLQPLAHTGSNSSLAEAGKFAAASFSKRQPGSITRCAPLRRCAARRLLLRRRAINCKQVVILIPGLLGLPCACEPAAMICRGSPAQSMAVASPFQSASAAASSAAARRSAAASGAPAMQPQPHGDPVEPSRRSSSYMSASLRSNSSPPDLVSSG